MGLLVIREQGDPVSVPVVEVAAVTLDDLSVDELDEVLDSLVDDVPVVELLEPTLDDLTEDQLETLLEVMGD